MSDIHQLILPSSTYRPIRLRVSFFPAPSPVLSPRNATPQRNTPTPYTTHTELRHLLIATRPTPTSRTSLNPPALLTTMPASATARRAAALKAAETRKRRREEAEARQAAEAGLTQGDPPQGGPLGGGYVTPAQLEALATNMAATISASDGRIDSLEGKLDRVLGLLEREGGGQLGGEGNSSGDGRLPLRGQHGECPRVSVRYAYIDEKLRGDAMLGKMDPLKLPNLLPDTSPLASTSVMASVEEFQLGRASDGSDNIVYKLVKATAAQSVAKFIKSIPSPTVFAAAWGIFTDLVLHGLKPYDPDTIANAHSALRFHEFWILERARDFTWESIMAYHLAVAHERFAEGFRCDLWYKNVDSDTWTRLQRRLPDTRVKTAPLPTTHTAAGPSRRSAAPVKTEQRCNNWNMGVCKGKCDRKHVCKNCGGDHMASACPTAQA